MAIFRVAKTRDYTVMSNCHLRDKTLTLKAKGLLSVLLSLPENWNYTTRGLAAICKEGVDSIGTTLRELENAGYLTRRRLRDQNGAYRTRSMSFMRARARSRKWICRKRIYRIRLRHVRKTRIWYLQTWKRHERIYRIRKTRCN